jgi:competence protein ComEC
MRATILAFVGGTVWLQQQPTLGSVWPAWLCVAAALFSLWLLWRHVGDARYRFWLSLLLGMLAAFALGFAIAHHRAHARLSAQWPVALEAVPVTVTGRIVDLVQQTPWGSRFKLELEMAPAGVGRLVLLSDYAKTPAPWQPGQRWTLTARFKRPHGLLNPGGRDVEAWMLSENIVATGTVAHQSRVLHDVRMAMPASYLDMARAALGTRIRATLGEAPHAGVIVALANGDQSAVPQSDWTLFRNTGLTHLVSISGLHVTLVAGLAGWLVSAAWRRSARLLARAPAQQAGVLAALCAAVGYSLLAGFSVPTQRTLFMVLAASLALLMRRRFAPSTIWCLALGACVVFDPWAVLSPGFWLSFLIVGALLYAFSAQRPAQGWRVRLAAWGHAQWVASLASLPLLIGLFQQMPLASPLANAVAIPLIGSGVTVLTLAGVLDPTGQLWSLAHALLAFTLDLVAPLADIRWQWHQAAPPMWALLLAASGVAILLLPRAVPGRLAGVLLCFPVLWPQTAPPLEAGSYRMTVFDVGQGLSVLIETARHTLLFDTGPPAAGLRVLPQALRALGIRQLDRLVLSHDDTDHIGAAAQVIDAVSVRAIMGTLPKALSGRGHIAMPCAAGQRWVWDAVVFEVLHPDDGVSALAPDNAKSCVLRVSGLGGRVLIPADIGHEEEAALLAKWGETLRADVVILPHHGSKTSSDPAFVAAVAPRWAVATVGYRNRYRHPREEVIARYETVGAQVWRTDRDGAMRWALQPEGIRALRWREAHRRYWHDAADGWSSGDGGQPRN